MATFTIAQCGKCGVVWAIDYQPDECDCDAWHEELDLFTEVEAADYRGALAAVTNPPASATGGTP